MKRCELCLWCGEAGYTETSYEYDRPVGDLEQGSYHTEFSERCPYCGGYVDEAEQCADCRSWELPENMVDGVCMSCLREHMSDPDFMREYLEKFLGDTDKMEMFIDSNKLWTDFVEFVKNY